MFSDDRRAKILEAHRGGVMVWAMILPNFSLHLRRLTGRIDSDKYTQMLSDVEPVLENIYGRGQFIFQQDNAPIHTSKKAKGFFSEHEWDVLDWPARRPDLNIIENVWHMISLLVYANQQYDSADSLWMAIQNAAETIMLEKREQLRNLYEDIPQRLIEVVESKGAIIKR